MHTCTHAGMNIYVTYKLSCEQTKSCTLTWTDRLRQLCNSQTCMHIDMNAQTPTYRQIHAYTLWPTYIHAYILIQKHTYIHTYTHIQHTHTHTYITCTCTHTYNTYTYIHIHIFTNTYMHEDIHNTYILKKRYSACNCD